MVDFFESMFDLMDTLTFNLREIQPPMWAVFEAMYKSFKGPSVDYLDGTSVCCRVTSAAHS